MIIVPHLRWRTFRYWAIRASDVRGIGSSPGALQIILDLCIPEKELAKTRSQISFI
jgi:hypothetical protein